MLTLYTRSAKLIYVPLANYIRDLAVEVYKVSLADENTLAFQTFVMYVSTGKFSSGTGIRYCHH